MKCLLDWFKGWCFFLQIQYGKLLAVVQQHVFTFLLSAGVLVAELPKNPNSNDTTPALCLWCLINTH